MSWSYDSSALGTHLNWVRLMVGDTDTNVQLISDEEITGALALEPRREQAAALVADAIGATFAARGGVKEAEGFFMLADRLRTLARPGYL